MADTTQSPSPISARLARIDKAWLALVLILVAVAVLDLPQLRPTIEFTLGALGHTAPFILFAVFAIGYLKATGAETILAKAFEGRETRMILFAALLGGLSPFCSCEVIPFHCRFAGCGRPPKCRHGFLACLTLDGPCDVRDHFRHTWDLSSHLPKRRLSRIAGPYGWLPDYDYSPNQLSLLIHCAKSRMMGGCCGVKQPFQGKPVWKFWQEAERRETFKEASLENGLVPFEVACVGLRDRSDHDSLRTREHDCQCSWRRGRTANPCLVHWLEPLRILTAMQQCRWYTPFWNRECRTVPP